MSTSALSRGQLWHLSFSESGRATLYPGEAQLLAGLQSLVRVAGGQLLLFCIVDDHIHVVVETARAPDLAGALLRSLAPTTAGTIEPAHREEVKTRRHLERLVRYVVAQPDKHGLPVHPALWPGSCFLDLIGARRLRRLSLQLARHLPRFRLREAFAAVSLSTQPLLAMRPSDVRRLGAGRVVAAAAAATGIALLTGKDARAVAARRAAATTAAEAAIPPAELAFALGIHARSARRLMLAEEVELALPPPRGHSTWT